MDLYSFFFYSLQKFHSLHRDHFEKTCDQNMSNKFSTSSSYLWQCPPFSRSIIFNSDFSSSKSCCYTKVCSIIYLRITGRSLLGFIPFPRVLVLYEIHITSLKVWTRIAKSTSNVDNHYTTNTFIVYFYKSFHNW